MKNLTVKQVMDKSKDDDLRKEYVRNVKTSTNVPEGHYQSQPDKDYLNLLQILLYKAKHSSIREDRTGTGTVSVFGHQMRFDLSEQFPILNTKRIYFKGVVAELLWFLRGDTNIKYLLEHNCSIWTDWRLKAFNENCNSKISLKNFEYKVLKEEFTANTYGSIGRGYGHQWRNFGEVTLSDCDTDLSETMNHEAKTPNDVVKKGFDQIKYIINEIKTNPTSRRLVVSGWNPHDINQVDLPPCHTLFQFYVENGKLSCQLYQRKN